MALKLRTNSQHIPLPLAAQNSWIHQNMTMRNEKGLQYLSPMGHDPKNPCPEIKNKTWHCMKWPSSTDKMINDQFMPRPPQNPEINLGTKPKASNDIAVTLSPVVQTPPQISEPVPEPPKEIGNKSPSAIIPDKPSQVMTNKTKSKKEKGDILQNILPTGKICGYRTLEEIARDNADILSAIKSNSFFSENKVCERWPKFCTL